MTPLRAALPCRYQEAVATGLTGEVFTSSDGLGWVYQFWQSDKKDEVNASERKIGGADLGPVTQLFTENYMVRFLLENSLGAWWAARHPDSPLLKEWEFLRFDDDGNPAAGSFDGWPETVAEVTVMDPCCGSGHFLTEAFEMLWRMRVEEEALDPISAQNAVLTDNLFGLELDPRCVQIAMFNIALTAWKAGNAWRQLPEPNVACCGIPVKAPIEEWKNLAGGDPAVENALVRLHMLFKDADTLGSLIDPRRAAEQIDPTGQTSLDSIDWDTIQPLLNQALSTETVDPATTTLGHNAQTITRAANLLSRQYTLITTNPPYLTRQAQSGELREFLDGHLAVGSPDLASAFAVRFTNPSAKHGSLSAVCPLGWFFQPAYRLMRETFLESLSWNLVGRLGPRAFRGISGEIVSVSLTILSMKHPDKQHQFQFIDAFDGLTASDKEHLLASERPSALAQRQLRLSPASRIGLGFCEQFRTIARIRRKQNGYEDSRQPQASAQFLGTQKRYEMATVTECARYAF